MFCIISYNIDLQIYQMESVSIKIAFPLASKRSYLEQLFTINGINILLSPSISTLCRFCLAKQSNKKLPENCVVSVLYVQDEDCAALRSISKRIGLILNPYPESPILNPPIAWYLKYHHPRVNNPCSLVMSPPMIQIYGTIPYSIFIVRCK